MYNNKSSRIGKSKKEKEESGEDKLSASLDEYLVVKKANILRKSKSDASAPSSRWSRNKSGKSFDKASATASSSDSSFSSALSVNPSQDKILKECSNETDKSGPSQIDDKTFEECSEEWKTCSSATKEVETSNAAAPAQISNSHMHPSLSSCDMNVTDSQLSASKSPSESSKTCDLKDCNLSSNVNAEDASAVAKDILQEALTETSMVDELQGEVVDCQDLAEVIASVAAAQACLENLEEDCEKRVEELEKQRDEEVAKSEALLHRVTELQDLKDKLSDLVSSMECSYSETINTMNETHAFQLEISKLESEKTKKELLSEITELSGKLLVAESLLVGKDEIEAALKNQIMSLENTLHEKEEHCKEELECMVSKNLKNEVLIAAKGEIENEVLNESGIEKSEEVDRAWLVTDLRRQESELSFFKIEDLMAKENTEPWPMTDLHCAFLTVHSPSLKSVEISCDDPNDNVPMKRMKRSEEKCDLNSCQGDIRVQYEVKQQLEEMKEQLENLEKEQMSLSIKNSVLEENLINRSHRLNKEIAEKEQLHKNYQMQREELKAALEKIRELERVSREMTDLPYRVIELEKALECSCDKNESLSKKCADMENSLSVIMCERDSLGARNKELEETLSKVIEEVKLKESLEVQLTEYKELFEKLQQGFNQSRLSLGSSRRGDSTIYMEYFPPVPIDEGTQTENNPDPEMTEAKCQTDRDSIDERCASIEQEINLFAASVDKLATEKETRIRLEKELETSWTDRCEVEEQLACALAENSVLTKRVNTLKQASRRLSLLITPGVSSPSAWRHLYDNSKEIMADLGVLSCAWNEGGDEEPKEEDDNKAGLLDRSISSLRELNDMEIPCRVDAGERMEPEGGALPPTSESFVSAQEPQAAHELTQTDEALFDQNSSTLFDIVQELLRYMGACENELNCSLGERLRITPDISAVLENSNNPDLKDELDRCVAQLKEEVAHIFAISRRSDLPGTVHRLQEELQSLEQQVAASDKQVKSMRAFVDEQAAEREQERDEFSRQLNELNELLRQKERQIMGCEQLKSDIDNLEHQLQLATSALKKCEEERNDFSTKLEEAMNKIWTMRDIISELEKDVATRSEELEAIKHHNVRLQNQLLQLGQISLEMETASKDSHTDLLAYVAKLEEEVTSLRHRVELTNPESIAATRASLRDLEVAIARRTKELELVTVASNVLSSASEDVSTRELADITRCPTPDEMKAEIPVGLEEDVDRLKERLLKHSRAEEAALRRIKEMEVQSRKVEELQVDLEVAMHRLESYLSENALLKAKIEEQRPKTFQKQLVSDMEQRVRQIEKELENVREELRGKDQQLADSRKREERLVEAMAAQEAMFHNEYSQQSAIKSELQSEKQRVEDATARLQELSNLPNVFNVLLAEKNEEIDMLKMQVAEASLNEVRTSSSINAVQAGSKTSSTIGGKRVKFSVPESFVESITPIPLEPSLVMRNASESQNNWFVAEPPSKRCLPWDNISSMAALQLSPRGISSELVLPLSSVASFNSSLVPSPKNECSTDSLAPNKSADDTICQEHLIKLEQSQLDLLNAQKEVESSKAALKQLTDTCYDYESSLSALNLENKEKEAAIVTLKSDLSEKADLIAKQNKKLDSLRGKLKHADIELKKMKGEGAHEIAIVKRELAKMNSENSENEEFKRLAREAVDEVREKLSCADSELKKRIFESEKLNEQVRELTEIMRKERELNDKKVLDANSQLSDIIKQLTKQQEETKALKETLLRTCEELEVARSERKEILTNRDEKMAFLEKEISVREAKVQQLNEALEAKDREIQTLRKESEEKFILNAKLSQEKESLEKLLKESENATSAVKSILLNKETEIAEIRNLSEQKISVLTSGLDKSKEMLDMEKEKLTQVLLELEGCARRKINNDEMDKLKEEIKKQRDKANLLEERLQEQEHIIQDQASALEEKTRFLSVLEGRLLEERRKAKVLEERSAKQEITLSAGGDNATQNAVPVLEAGSPRHEENPDRGNFKEDVFLMKERIALLEKLVTTLEKKLSEELARYDEDANIMSQLRTSLEKCLDKTESLQSELSLSQRRSESLETELSRTRAITQELQDNLDTAQTYQAASLRREEDLMNQLSAAQTQVRRLTSLVESQAVQVHALSALHSHDFHPPQMSPSAIMPRAIRSAGDGAETPQEWRLRVQRLESYRKALVWQKRYLQLRTHGGVRAWGSRRRVTFRTVGILVIAMLRMKFLVRRWRSRLPPLPSPLSKERRLVLASPPNKDPGLRPKVAS